MEHLPPWLRNVPLPPRPAAAGDAPVAGGADEDVPDWLRELQGEIGGAQQPPAADWMADLRAADTPPEEPPAAGDDLSWMADPRAAPPEEPPAPPADEQISTTSRVRMPVGATDWLRSIGQDPDAKSEPLSEPLSTPIDESGVPDWLRDLSPDEVARAVEAEPPPDSQPRFDPQAPGWLVDDLIVPDASTVSADPPEGRPLAEETADAGDVPDWLRDVIGADDDEFAPRAGPPEADAGPGLAASAEMPAWLRDLGESSAPAPPASAAPEWLPEDEEPEPPAQAVEMPAWLREAEQGGAPGAPEPPGADEEMPAWLREAEQGGAPGAPEPPGADEEVPAWLREAEQDQPPPVGDHASPTWLRDALAERGVDLGGPAQAEDDVPPWLADDAPPAPLPAPPQRPAADLPPWLAGDTSAPSAAPGQPAQGGDLALPSWLRGVADEPPAVPPPARGEPPPAPPRRPAPVAEESDSSSGFMRGAELPSWLRVPEPELPGETAEGQQLDWLRRLGGPEQDDELDNGAPVATADRPQRLVYRRSPEQREAIGLLESLSRAPYPAPVALPAPAPRTALQRIGLDRIFYALLALALILGLLFPQLTAPFQAPAPASLAADELGALLDGLDSEDVALVAYEWGAQRSSELRPLEQAVLSRLIADKTKLILVSTDMQGTLLSFDLRDPLRAAGYNVEADGREFGGRDYVLLGYRPGGELALRSLAQDLRGELASDFTGQDATQGLVANNADGTPRVSSLGDLGLILVLADQPQDVQVWMEQVHRAAPDVPIVFLLPQEAEPLAQPYLRLPGVYHVAGQQGALALLASDGAADPAALAQTAGRYWYSVLVFVVLMLLGGLGAALARARARRARGGAA